MSSNQVYSEEFKKETIMLAKQSDKAVTALSREMGLGKNTLGKWIRESKISETGEIVTDTELTKLRRELADVKMERDILKKAVAIFSKPQK